MNENLPFTNCNDVELSNVLSVERNQISTQNGTMAKNKNKCNVILAQYMPFYKCSDYWIQREYLSNSEKFLKFFENNTFTTICRSFIEDLTKETIHVNIIMKINLTACCQNIKKTLLRYFI